MKEIIINIDFEDNRDIQTLAHEVNALKNVVCQMIETDRDTSTNAFINYHKSYIKANADYENAKSGIEKKYVLSNPEVINYKNKVNWNLDYATAELTITPVETSSTSNCSCKG